MDKFEYLEEKWCGTDDGTLTSWLSIKGNDGWELCVLGDGYCKKNFFACMFKRKIVEPQRNELIDLLIEEVEAAWRSENCLFGIGTEELNKLISEYKLNNPTPIKQSSGPRYFIDIRGGCGAVRDRLDTRYDKDYPGLHSDTPDVIAYKHGFLGEGKWNMKPEDIEFLNNLCDILNKKEDGKTNDS